jgi:hypothetical protein
MDCKYQNDCGTYSRFIADACRECHLICNLYIEREAKRCREVTTRQKMFSFHDYEETAFFDSRLPDTGGTDGNARGGL